MYLLPNLWNGQTQVTTVALHQVRHLNSNPPTASELDKFEAMKDFFALSVSTLIIRIRRELCRTRAAIVKYRCVTASKLASYCVHNVTPTV